METKLASSRILITSGMGGWGGWVSGEVGGWMLAADRGHNFTKPLSFLSFLFLTSQQSLLRQQERVEERVQEIEEQLCKLDSDKCVVEVRCGRKRSYTHVLQRCVT